MQQESLFKFLDAISDLCSDRQTVANVDLDNLNHACALMERNSPISLQASVRQLPLDFGEFPS